MELASPGAEPPRPIDPYGEGPKGDALMLSDKSIQKAIRLGDIGIEPAPGDIQFQPVSVDLRLGECDSGWFIGDKGERIFMIYPNQFALASTLETVNLSRNIAGTVHGKSTWARRGLQV